MKAKTGFDAAMLRATHLLVLYDLLNDTRERRIRKGWATKFKHLMRWPSREQIVRVDGKNRNCLVILRESSGIDRKHFAHDYLSELLRGALVAAVSALDRYLHDLIVEHSIKLLSRKEEDIPRELARLSVPILQTKRALEKLRSDVNSRPGHLIKQAIQEQIHREFTFQKPESVQQAGRMLGVKDFWRLVSNEMPGAPTAQAVTEQLRKIAERRNQIVHEADLMRRTRSRRVTLREIRHKEAAENVAWVGQLGSAIEVVVSAAV